jgi:polysaccharide biosynthesis transport protein
MTSEPSDSGEINLHFLDYWRVVRVRFPLIVLVLLLVIITAAVVTYFMPKQYASAVTMQVRENAKAIQVYGNDAASGGFDPRFLTTQFEIIQRKEILYPVIEALGLEKKWGLGNKEQVFFKLKRMIDVRELRNTELISIIVYSTDPKEAAEIANSIATEYVTRRTSEQDNTLSKGLVQLQDEVGKQRVKAEELREKRDRIREQMGIQDMSPDSQEDGELLEAKKLVSTDDAATTARNELAVMNNHYQQIKQLSDDQLIRSGPTLLQPPDPIISQLLPLYNQAETDLARMLNGGLGPNHPTVKSLVAQKNTLREQLNKQIAAVRIAMEEGIKAQQSSLDGLEVQLKSRKEEQQEEKTKAASYYQAKNAYIQAKKLLDASEMRLSTESVEKTIPQSPATIWERAEASAVPAKPNVWLNIGLGGVVGLVFGVGSAFFIEYLDTSVKTMEDVETFLKVPVLAVIPKGISLLLYEPKDTVDAEAYRILRTNVEFNRKNPEANTITVISGGAGEGKSTTLANLAFIFASGGYSTLIVDADLRRPSQHRVFEVENEIGLTDFLTTDIHLEEVISQTKVDNLYLMTSGRLPSDAVGILNSQRMVDLIEDVKNRFDIVFFDSPPILGVSDASVLSSAVDLTIIVVQHRRFPRAMLQRVKQAILNVGGNILGVVLNNVDVRHDQHYQYYTSYYNYYQDKPSKSDSKKKRKTTVAANKEETGAHDSY